MPSITGSLTPFLLHRSQVPKWLALAGLAAATAWLHPPLWWAWILLGVVLYFPQEYLIHRFGFHHLAGTRYGDVFARAHVIHHKHPDELKYMWVQPIVALPLGALYLGLYVGLAFLLGAANPLGVGVALSLGNFLGLQVYEWYHYQAHRPGRRITPWGRFIKRVHLLHHYKNEGFWFGVSWGGVVGDLLMGTWADKDEVERSDTVRDLGLEEERWKEGG